MSNTSISKTTDESNSQSMIESTDYVDEGPTKRHAQIGQWQTPPVPSFPSVKKTTGTDESLPEFDSTGLGDILLGSLSAPQSTDDIAKALQEAFRRGQEAYRRKAEMEVVAHSSQSNLTLDNTPMLQTRPVEMNASYPTIPEMICLSNTDLQHSTEASVTAPSIISHTNRVINPYIHSNPINTSVFAYNALDPSVEMSTTHTNMTNSKPADRLLHPNLPTTIKQTKSFIPLPVNLNAPTINSTHVPELVTSNNIPTASALTRSSIISGDKRGPARSVSLPDISSYVAQTNAEEHKRLKRLERNRASARLRRLKKKNLVDSYELEVGMLESSLAKLRAHRWGVGTDIEALLEALSMDRGQQVLDTDKRKEILTSLLSQQQDQVRTLMDCQMESMVLGLVSRQSAQQGQLETLEPDLQSLVSELDELLHLSDDQKKQLATATMGSEDEYRASQTIDQCLTTLLSTNWLMNNGIEECTKPFTSILNTGQMSKFLLWADHNSEAIDQLDFVNASTANSHSSNGPLFAFGIEDSAQGDDFEEK